MIKAEQYNEKHKLITTKCSCCGNVKKDLTLKDREYM
jgi:hypothetical protein